MKVLMINSVCGIRSTGRICSNLAETLEKQGHQVKIAYGRAEVPEKFQKYACRIGSKKDLALHGVKARLFDASGMGSKAATKRFIKWVKEFDPDIIHLHNIHGYYIHIGVLFDYLRNCGKKIIWTLHDGWAFTGHCACFDSINCRRWENGCYRCPKKKSYPTSITDRSLANWKYKKAIFSGIQNMTIITPSEWLAGLVKQSFLKEYPIKVINNGIDTTVFVPTPSDFREKHGLSEKKIVLGVASAWSKGKGLYDFVKLSELLGEGSRVVLVGLSEKQKEELPENIVGISRTNNTKELAEIYSAADVFVNPTYDDNYPTVNLEAIACHTPIITYNTGGSPESALKYNGEVVEKGNVIALAEAIKNINIRECPLDAEQRKMLAAETVTEKYFEIYCEK